MTDLRGHAALITGSSKGVGRSIAEAYAHAGCDVIIHGRTRGDDAEQVITNCKKHNVKVDFVAGDLLAPTQQAVEDLFTASIKVNPKIDILVNNAGQYFDEPFLSMTHERFDNTVRLNIASPYFLTQRFAQHWIANNVAGRVLMIGSINGQLAEEQSTAYDTSKGALLMMMRTLTVALAPHNIRVNGLAPGLVLTPQTKWLEREPAKKAWLTHHTPNNQIPHSDVCGPGAVYLVSDDAQHVHGQMLLIDGGLSVWQHPDPPKQ